MQFRDVPERDRYAFSALPTCMRTGTGHHRPSDDDDAQRCDEQSSEPDDLIANEWFSTRLVRAREVEHHERDGEHHEGEHEMQRDEVRVELREDDETAEDDLRDEAANEAGSGPDQVSPSWLQCHRREKRHDGNDRHGDRYDSVRELDQRVERCRRDEMALEALGPVRTTETRTGEPHRATRENQERVANDRSERERADRPWIAEVARCCAATTSRRPRGSRAGRRSSPDPHRCRGASNRYPTPRIVVMRRGCEGSTSMCERSRLMWTSRVFVSPT